MESPSPQPPDYSRLSHGDLDEELCLLCSHLYASEYRLLTAIREWDSRGLCGQYGVRSTAHWLNFKCGIAMGAAREKVRVARALTELPKVSALFARGEISYSKVRALTRVATASNEAYLIHVALNGTASHMERMVSAYRRLERLHDPERILRQRRERGLNWYWDDDGMLVIHGRFPPEEGALLVRAIEVMRDRLYREERALESDDPRERLHGRVEPDVESPAAARRGDALLRLVESGVAGEPSARSGADRVQVILHMPVQPQTAAARTEPREAAVSTSAPEKPREPAVSTSPPEKPREPAAAASAPEEASAAEQASVIDEASSRFDDASALPRVPRLEPGTAISWATARRLACDATRAVLVESGKGEPLSVGRRSRSVPWRLRRALEQRDGGCRFPGCTEHRHVDAHHIHHWADGGETSLENLVLLCRFHHRLVHEEGFDCERRSDGELCFRYPDGSLVPEAFPLKRGSFEGLVELNEQAGLSITSKTCNGGWDGGRVDFCDLVHLLQLRTHGPGWEPPIRPPRQRLSDETLQRIEALTGELPHLYSHGYPY